MNIAHENVFYLFKTQAAGGARMKGITANFLVLQGRNEVKNPSLQAGFCLVNLSLSVLLVTVLSIKTKKNNSFFFSSL